MTEVGGWHMKGGPGLLYRKSRVVHRTDGV